MQMNVVCLLMAKNIQHEQNKTKRTACSVSSKGPAYLLELLHVSGRAKVIKLNSKASKTSHQNPRKNEQRQKTKKNTSFVLFQETFSS